MSKPWKGIFVIVVTPFTASHELDDHDRREIDAIWRGVEPLFTV